MAEHFIFEPFRLGQQGGVSVTTDADRHLRDKILAVLFTSPGERLNRPTFGVGLNRALFETLDELTVGALEYSILEGLERDIGEEMITHGVDVDLRPESGELVLNIRFARREDRLPRNLEIVL